MILLIIHVENEKAELNPIIYGNKWFRKSVELFLKLKIQEAFACAITYMSFYLFIYKIAIHAKSTSCGVTAGA